MGLDSSGSEPEELADAAARVVRWVHLMTRLKEAWDGGSGIRLSPEELADLRAMLGSLRDGIKDLRGSGGTDWG